MPIIDLKVSGPENPAVAQQLVTEISRLTKEVLKKKTRGYRNHGFIRAGLPVVR